jgi:5'-nucleotidase
VAPLVSRVVAEARAAVTRTPTAAGESALGDLIAESQRVALGADFAVMNPGGIRADLDAGTVTWGELFSVQPFCNTLVAVTLTGEQLYALLNEQWSPAQPSSGRILQIAGFGYTWGEPAAAGGGRVVELHDARGRPIDRRGTYRVVANGFLAAGGDNFTVLRDGTERVGGPGDLDALIAYLKSLPQPFVATTDGRIRRR